MAATVSDPPRRATIASSETARDSKSGTPAEEASSPETMQQLEDQKILVTGATGAIALPTARALARRNRVIGAARFRDPALRSELEDAGVETVEIDLERGEIDAIPEDVDYVLHYAYTRRPSGEFHAAIQVNALGAGHVLARCRAAKAALVVSAATLYSAHDDAAYAYREEDDIGFVRAPWAASSPVSKVTLEAVARFCAEAFELPTTLVRPSVPYGCTIDMLTSIVDSVLAGTPVFAVHDPQPVSIIHIDDMIDQIPALLGAARVPATILNWASDEVVSVQTLAARVGERVGKTPTFQVSNAPGAARGAVVDTTRVREVVGPCRRRLDEALPEIIEARQEMR